VSQFSEYNIMNVLKSLLKFVPVDTILGWLLPDVEAKLAAVKANPVAENYVALGEAVANAALQEFDPALLPKVEAYETLAAPAITAIIGAIDEPGIKTTEAAIVSAITVIAQVIGSKATADEIQGAAIGVLTVLNKEIGA
jgi:hypothetical protein